MKRRYVIEYREPKADEAIITWKPLLEERFWTRFGASRRERLANQLLSALRGEPVATRYRRKT